MRTHIRGLVLSDSKLLAQQLAQTLDSIDDVKTVGITTSLLEAQRTLQKQSIDLAVVISNNPETTGLELIRQLRACDQKLSIVFVLPTDHPNRSRCAIDAVRLRARECPYDGKPLDQVIHRKKLALTLHQSLGLLRACKITQQISEIGQITSRFIPRKVSKPAPKKYTTMRGRFAIVVIGISTGGPQALAQMLPALPRDFPLPILIVQHMPPQFTHSMAESLNRKCVLNVREAREGDPVRSGSILLAQGGKHLTVSMRHGAVVAALSMAPPENSCRPAADVLFRSVAEVYGSRGVLAVVMTGMGHDGTVGVEALKQRRCYCITESEESCAVYGMPQSVDEAGLSDESAPLDSLAHRIDELARNGA